MAAVDNISMNIDFQEIEVTPLLHETLQLLCSPDNPNSLNIIITCINSCINSYLTMLIQYTFVYRSIFVQPNLYLIYVFNFLCSIHIYVSC